MDARDRVKDALGAGLLLLVVAGLVWMSYMAFVAPKAGCGYGPLCW